MSEYFQWINITKSESLDGSYFADSAIKLWGASGPQQGHFPALHTLLRDRWKGDRILFWGDEFEFSETLLNPALRSLAQQAFEAGYADAIDEFVHTTYREVAALFREAETEVRREIRFYLETISEDPDDRMPNEFKIDRKDPFAGLFQCTGKRSRYVINCDKKLCYAMDKTQFLRPDGTELSSFDPLPMLLRCSGNKDVGPWVGDRIAVSEEVPAGIACLESLTLDR